MAHPQSGLLTEFLLSTSWSDSRRLLVLHPELLDPATDELVEGLIATRRRNGEELYARAFEQQLGLLQRCRKVGVDAASAELSGQPGVFVLEEEPDAVRRQAEDAQQHSEWTEEGRSLEVAVNLWLRFCMEFDVLIGSRPAHRLGSCIRYSPACSREKGGVLHRVAAGQDARTPRGTTKGRLWTVVLWRRTEWPTPPSS